MLRGRQWERQLLRAGRAAAVPGTGAGTGRDRAGRPRLLLLLLGGGGGVGRGLLPAPPSFPSPRPLARVGGEEHALARVYFLQLVLGELLHVQVGGVEAEGGVLAMVHQFLFAFLVEGEGVMGVWRWGWDLPPE